MSFVIELIIENLKLEKEYERERIFTEIFIIFDNLKR